MAVTKDPAFLEWRFYRRQSSAAEDIYDAIELGKHFETLVRTCLEWVEEGASRQHKVSMPAPGTRTAQIVDAKQRPENVGLGQEEREMQALALGEVFAIRLSQVFQTKLDATVRCSTAPEARSELDLPPYLGTSRAAYCEFSGRLNEENRFEIAAMLGVARPKEFMEAPWGYLALSEDNTYTFLAKGDKQSVHCCSQFIGSNFQRIALYRMLSLNMSAQYEQKLHRLAEKAELDLRNAIGDTKALPSSLGEIEQTVQLISRFRRSHIAYLSSMDEALVSAQQFTQNIESCCGDLSENLRNALTNESRRFIRQCEIDIRYHRIYLAEATSEFERLQVYCQILTGRFQRRATTLIGVIGIVVATGQLLSDQPLLLRLLVIAVGSVACWLLNEKLIGHLSRLESPDR